MPSVTIQQALDLATQHHRAGRLTEAEAIYRQILAAVPDHPGATHLLGVLSGMKGDLGVAEEFLRRSIALAPRDAMFYVNLARFLAQYAPGRLAEVPDLYRRALEIVPREPLIYYDLGTTLQLLKRFDEALAAYEQALDLKPDFAQACNNKGSVLKEKGRFEEALTCYGRALELQPNLLEAHANLGALFHAQRRFEEAVNHYQKALQINPGHAQVLFSLGISLFELARFEDAIAVYRRAIELQPGYVDARINLGNSLRMIGQIDEAILAYQAALRIDPRHADAYNNLGVIYDLKGQLADALSCYRKAVELKPQDSAAHSNLLLSLHFHPDWLANPRRLLEEHRIWIQRHVAPLHLATGPHTHSRDPERRLRIGYVSPDFRQHAVGRFMLPLITEHDKSTVEIFCYTDVTDSDWVTQRIRERADHWRSIVGVADQDVAELVRRDQIDILVDLTMHLRGSRLLVFARKPAPLQVTYLAYCSTTGLDAIDYRLSDPFLDPPDADLSMYAEKTFHIPAYWCYAEPQDTLPINSLPALASGTITFGCLNNFCKVSPAALETWGKLLLAVPGSRLLIHANPGSHRDKAKMFLAAMGVEPARCDFAPAGTLEQYFAHYHQIDIALDPFPYAGGTTTCDALWMGVPVVTLRGFHAVGRGGVSILSNLGHPEWIAQDKIQYIDIAARLARDLPRVAELRGRLRDEMRTSRVMDAPAFARNIESAYRQMWQRWCVAT